jgi:hypothetical protein
MATSQSALKLHANLSIHRLAATGAVGAALNFILCWLGTLIPFPSPPPTSNAGGSLNRDQ